MPNNTLQPTPVGALSCISHLSPGVAELGRSAFPSRERKHLIARRGWINREVGLDCKQVVGIRATELRQCIKTKGREP